MLIYNFVVFIFFFDLFQELMKVPYCVGPFQIHVIVIERTDPERDGLQTIVGGIQHQIVESEFRHVGEGIEGDAVGCPLEGPPIIFPFGLVLIDRRHKADIDRVRLTDQPRTIADAVQMPSAIKIPNGFAFESATRHANKGANGNEESCENFCRPDHINNCYLITIN